MHKLLRWLPVALCLPWAPDACAQLQLEPSWRYLPGFFRPGQAGLEVLDIDADGRSDVVMSGSTRSGSGEFFAVLRQTSDGLSLTDKIPLPAPLVLFDFAVHGGGAETTLAAQTTGVTVSVFEGEALDLVRTFPASLSFETHQVADVDGDGDLEVLGVNVAQSAILHLEDGSTHWHGQGVRYGMAAAQFDGDAPLEIVLSDSAQIRVLDGETLIDQGFLDGVPSGRVLTGNFDADSSTAEIAVVHADVISIVATAPSLGVVSSHSIQGLSRLRALDVDGDGVDEIVGVSEAGIVALEPLGWTTVFSFVIEQGEVVQGYTFGNLDSDPSVELVLSTRREDSSANTLRLVDIASSSEQTLLREEGGPFSDLVVGDIDGDGRKEVVIVTSSGADVGRVVVLDASTGAVLRQASLEVTGTNTGRSFVVLADLDADPQKEIVVGSNEASWSHLRALDGLSLDVEWSRSDLLSSARLTSLSLLAANDDDVDDVALVIGRSVLVVDGTSGDMLWNLDALPQEAAATTLLTAIRDDQSRPELILSDGSSTVIIDIGRQAIRRVIPDTGEVIGQAIEGSGPTCRLIQFGTSELVRRHCETGIEDSRRAYAAPAIMAVRPVGDSYGDLVLSDGARVLLQSGQLVQAVGTRRDVRLGLNNQAAMFVDRGAPVLVVGGGLGVQRIELDPSNIFRDNFE